MLILGIIRIPEVKTMGIISVIMILKQVVQMVTIVLQSLNLYLTVVKGV